MGSAAAAAAAARRLFADEGVVPHAWSNDPGARYPTHRHDYHKVLVCVRGSITFHTPGGDVVIEPGERLDLPAGTPHAATVGPYGVECWEGYR